MVEEPRRVPCHIAIQVLLLTQAEDILVVLLASAQRLALADPFAHVFDNTRAFANTRLRKSPQPMNSRALELHEPRFECAFAIYHLPLIGCSMLDVEPEKCIIDSRGRSQRSEPR